MGNRPVGDAPGDAPAFRAFFDREVAGLIRYATRLLGSREDAQDVAQEAFFRLWQRRGRLDPTTNPARLLYTIARNLVRDRFRHRAVEERPHPYVGDSEEAEDGEEDRTDLVRRVLESLSPRQKEIVLLRWQRKLTYEQIGAELGISPDTASAHMQRAIAHLKRLVQTEAVCG